MRALYRSRWAVPSAALVALFAVVLAVAAWGRPVPAVHDEASYLLAADTFRQGRLANPPHRHWQHFEVPHVLALPTYVSKYPPGQGAILALGWRLGGDPLVGVWASVALFAAALCWMLHGWMPAAWAMGGGVAGGVILGSLSYWGHSYWGGLVAATGGALVFGALPRILRQATARDAAALGAGLLVLVSSRPFEGALVSAFAGLSLVAWGWRRRACGVGRRELVRVAVPIALFLGLAFALQAVYDLATTGRVAEMPYMRYEATYSPLPLSLLGSLRPLPEYRQPILRRLYVRSVARFRELRTASGWREHAVKRLGQLGAFALGPFFALPLLLLPWAWLLPGTRLAVAVWVVHLVVALAMYSYFPHYSAPAIALLVLLVVQCLRAGYGWLARLPRGTVLAPWLFAAFLALAGAERVVAAHTALGEPADSGFLRRRALVAEHFPDGRHLVLLRHGRRASIHDMWAANGADIDSQRVIWAHSLSDDADRRLIADYPDRKVWRVDVGFGGAHDVEVRRWHPPGRARQSAGGAADPPS